jgi:hypothetical protein
MYSEIPDLDNSLFSSDEAIQLAGWLKFAAEHPHEMERAIDLDLFSERLSALSPCERKHFLESVAYHKTMLVELAKCPP